MTKEEKNEKKKIILEYLESVPVYKWAAKIAMINQDTLKDWRKEDQEFSEQCEAKISEFVRKTAKKAKPEFQLERLLREDFSPRHELVGKDGEELFKSMTDDQLDKYIDAKTKQTGVNSSIIGEGEENKI